MAGSRVHKGTKAGIREARVCDPAVVGVGVLSFDEKTGFRVIDTGALSQSATLEALAFLHMQLQFTRGTNFGSAITIID
jgi:predicted dinucleotide-binding enzyme